MTFPQTLNFLLIFPHIFPSNLFKKFRQFRLKFIFFFLQISLKHSSNLCKLSLLLQNLKYTFADNLLIIPPNKLRPSRDFLKNFGPKKPADGLEKCLMISDPSENTKYAGVFGCEGQNPEKSTYSINENGFKLDFISHYESC